MRRLIKSLQNKSPEWWIVATSIVVSLLIGMLCAFSVNTEGAVSEFQVRWQAGMDGVGVGLLICALSFFFVIVTKRSPSPLPSV